MVTSGIQEVSYHAESTFAVSGSPKDIWRTLSKASRPLNLSTEHGGAYYNVCILLHPPKHALVPSGSTYSNENIVIKKSDMMLAFARP